MQISEDNKGKNDKSALKNKNLHTHFVDISAFNSLITSLESCESIIASRECF